MRVRGSHGGGTDVPVSPRASIGDRGVSVNAKRPVLATESRSRRDRRPLPFRTAELPPSLINSALLTSKRGLTAMLGLDLVRYTTVG